MPSKIKSKLLIITVLSTTLAILFVIAPATAEMYSIILLGLSMFMSLLAWSNSRGVVALQYNVSSFISLAVFIFVAIVVSVAQIAGADIQMVAAGACGIVTLRALTLLFGEYK